MTVPETSVELEPLIDLHNGDLVGVEALMRPVDQHRIEHDPMLAAAILELAAAATICPTIWVNVEPHHIGNTSLHNRLRHLAHFYGINVVVEITERGPLPTAAEVAILHASGFSVALDDVNPGRLAAAVQLGADIIKIDYPRGRSLARIVELVTDTGHRLVVEGIETGAQHAHAHTAGAHIGQGFHYQTTRTAS